MCLKADSSVRLKSFINNILFLCFFGLSINTYVAKARFTPKHQPPNEVVTVENQHDCLLRRITPYYNKPYKWELQLKQEAADMIINNIRDKLAITGTEMENVTIEQIVPSPEIRHYRNKDDFTVYPGVDGNITVGYLTGTPSLPGCFAVRPTLLSHIKESHKRLAKVFEDYVIRSSYKPCYSFNDGGLWKRLVVRSNEAGDLMAIVITQPDAIEEENMADERNKLKAHLLKYEPNLILYHQECAKVDCTNDLDSYIQLAGDKSYLEETMGGKKFQISPHSFFQINKQAAEQMVNNIWSEMDVTDQSTFLDLYCGVGLYSVVGSHRVRESHGIEILEGAVIDARKNAEINNVTNCKFTAGKVESCLSWLLRKSVYYTDQVMTLLNPSRAGTTKRVMNMLRLDKRIKKLIYVSCKPDNQHTTNNFVQLCTKSQHGTPFNLTRVKLFDLFPRTSHFEMVLEFSRLI